jgi:hypothetical protein
LTRRIIAFVSFNSSSIFAINESDSITEWCNVFNFPSSAEFCSADSRNTCSTSLTLTRTSSASPYFSENWRWKIHNLSEKCGFDSVPPKRLCFQILFQSLNLSFRLFIVLKCDLLAIMR